MDSANSDYELKTDQLALRILMVNFAAIHTSSIVRSYLALRLILRGLHMQSTISRRVQNIWSRCVKKLNLLSLNLVGRNLL